MGGGKRKYRALTPAQIAEALEVSSRTVCREFKKLGRPRVRPKLIYGV